jgi:hypothetical protein
MPPRGRHVAVAPGRHLPMWLVGAAAIVGLAGVYSTLGGSNGDERAPAMETATPTPANTRFPGITTFRGNASRSYYGEGPVPSAPVTRWKFPVAGSPKLCAMSAETQSGPKKQWCGTGWTGQPNVVPSAGGGMEVREGAFDDAYHFLDAGSGREIRSPLVTGDLAKGSATSDPAGFPLYYAGSRDNLLRIVGMDRADPTVLWELDANDSVPQPLWNDDWDGAALVVGDYLIEGGENSWLYVIRLHRSYDAGGLVTVAPEVVATIQGWDERLLRDVGDQDVSIENSVAFRDGVVYFANSGGLVQGWDISDLLQGGSDYQQVFRFWTGDDTDASIVIDDEGYLYVASEFQRFLPRGRETGQLMKLDPGAPDPLVWSLSATEIGFEAAGGSWSTPAIYGDRVYFTTAAGRVLEVDRTTGDVTWEAQIAAPAIASPVVVDGTLMQGDCSGHLYAWDVGAGGTPTLSWNLDLGDCIESTPAVWHGWLFVGTREGYLYGIADAETPAPRP